MAQLTKFQEELLNQSNETLNIYANSMQKSISGLLDDSKLQRLESIAQPGDLYQISGCRVVPRVACAERFRCW